MKIGNIISTTDLVNHTKVDYINYFDQKVSFQDLNSDLPTLYVGWNDFKDANKDTSIISGISILEKKVISKHLYWDFSFDENKSQHVGGVSLFVNDVPFYYFSRRYKYINYDPIFFNIQTIEELLLLLPTNSLNRPLLKGFGDYGKADCVYNFKNEMLYILKNNEIYGIDLKMYEFFDFDIHKIISVVSEKTLKYVFDEDASVYQIYYKTFPFFDQLKRYLVVLVSKE